MKLRLPSFLLSAVVAAQLCTTANADVVGSGVSYDVGKLSYSSDPSITKADDSLYCWAASGANALQYWQDTYLDYADKPAQTPNGIGDGYNSPQGTDYLEIYQEVIKNGENDKTGATEEMYNWWFKGEPVSNNSTSVLPSQDGYYNQLFAPTEDKDGQSMTTPVASSNLSTDPNGGLLASMKEIFAVQGQVPCFKLHVYDVVNLVPAYDFEKGENVMASQIGNFHSITCWGYESDGENVTALILSDSDDEYFGAFRVNVTYEDKSQYPEKYMVDALGLQWANAMPGPAVLTVLANDDQNSYYGNMLTFLASANSILTPESYVDAEGNTVDVAKDAKGADALGDNHTLLRNTSLTKDETISDDNLTVGDGQQIVILTSSGAENLTLEGNGDKEAGLDVKAGSLVSLKNVSVSGYTNGGMNLDGHGYFDNGSLEITDNSKKGNGAGALNEHYMEVKGNETVTVSGNSATGNGGGIANDKDATLSISGNGTVSFSGNTAAKGKDIYNAAGATALIVNNEEVTFASGKSAVTNDGALYLGNTTDQKITFKDSTLDGNGTTYIGQDVRKNNYDGAVDFTKGAQTTSIKANKSGTPATLDKLSVSAEEIIGTSAKASSVTGADIVSNGNLLMKSLTLDASDTIKTTSGAITMTNTVIKLKDFEHTTSSVEGGTQYIFDLSETLAATGTLTLNNVVFDTTGMGDLNIGDKDSVLITFAPTVVLTDAQLSKGADTNLRGELQGEHAVIFNGGNLAPEPATATLSLLALAALAARRKRH